MKARAKASRGWAWIIEFNNQNVLCPWAERTKKRLMRSYKPGPEAIPARVEITLLGERAKVCAWCGRPATEHENGITISVELGEDRQVVTSDCVEELRCYPSDEWVSLLNTRTLGRALSPPDVTCCDGCGKPATYCTCKEDMDAMG